MVGQFSTPIDSHSRLVLKYTAQVPNEDAPGVACGPRRLRPLLDLRRTLPRDRPRLERTGHNDLVGYRKWGARLGTQGDFARQFSEDMMGFWLGVMLLSLSLRIWRR